MKFFTTSKISENMHETPEGYLVCVGVSIARTGDMLYGAGETPLEPGPDGKVTVSRSEQEVFRPETIASFEGKSLTILHPDDFVSPDNWSELSKGILQNVRRGIAEQNSDLVADLLITDSVAINLVKNGLREVSCGYEAEYTQTGVGRGVQSNIIGNHLALVEEGRAGSSYAINDSASNEGKGSKMKLSEKIKAIFAKAQDEALKIADEETKVEPTKDSGTIAPQTISGDAMGGMKAYFDSKFEELKGGKKADDASTQPTQSEAANVVAKDEEKEKEDKKAARDAFIDAMMEKEKKDSEDSEESEEESEDASDESEEEVVSDKACDDASRIEILAPGLNAEGKGARVKALLAAYATTDGKEVIHQFTGGKALDTKNEGFVDAVFIGASEVLKSKRTAEFADTKSAKVKDFVSQMGTPKGAMSPEELNEKNSKYWANRK